MRKIRFIVLSLLLCASFGVSKELSLDEETLKWAAAQSANLLKKSKFFKELNSQNSVFIKKTYNFSDENIDTQKLAEQIFKDKEISAKLKPSELSKAKYLVLFALTKQIGAYNVNGEITGFVYDFSLYIIDLKSADKKFVYEDTFHYIHQKSEP